MHEYIKDRWVDNAYKSALDRRRVTLRGRLRGTPGWEEDIGDGGRHWYRIRGLRYIE